MAAEASECPICKEELKTANVTISDCEHKFHFKCLHNWIKKSNSCPICRKQLVEESNEEKKQSENLSDLSEFVMSFNFSDLDDSSESSSESSESSESSSESEDIDDPIKSKLRRYACEGNLDKLKPLIEMCQNQKTYNYTMRFAAVRGYINIVEFLIGKGANINTALKDARRNNRPELVKFLVSRGAK